MTMNLLLANLLFISIIVLCSALIISSSVHAAYDDREVDCSKNPPVGDEQGKVHQIASLCAYFTGKPHSKKPAVILLSDVWGYGVPKLRKFADKIASAGNYVVVPDMFFGDPTTNTTQKEVWLANHRPEEAVKYVKPLIQVLKEKGIHKIGAAGFCWGGKVVVELAKEVDIIPVAALLHPSYTTVDDIKGVKVPMALLVGERDNGTPPEYVKESTAALKANQVDYFVKVYPGMPHGWTIRYKDDIPAQKKYSEEACQDLVDWFGYRAPKLRKFADKVASAGYYVVVPDLLNGDPATSETNLQDWVVNHRPEQAVEYVKPVIQALKEKGKSKIGAAGFCWGAKAVVELAKEADIIQISALLHPSFVTLDDIKAVKVSIAILGGELDIYSPPELITEFEAALDAKPGVDHFVKIYPGMSHGWAIRYNDDDAAEVKCAAEACQDVVDWFSRYLKRNHSAL